MRSENRGGTAQDIHGLAAEHLKHAVDVISSPLANLMNYMLSCGYIPPMILEDLVTPMQKKNKDPTLPTNYRGITLLSIIGKVLEKVLQWRTRYTDTESVQAPTWVYEEVIVHQRSAPDIRNAE